MSFGIGRTTSIALKTLGESIGNPTQAIPITDHDNTSESNAALAAYIQTLTIKLGFDRTNVFSNEGKYYVITRGFGLSDDH